MHRPTWKNYAAFVAFPFLSAVMIPLSILLWVLLWPMCLVANFDRQDDL